jgi:alkyl hydroperoxide reductase subunit AhpC
VSQLKVKDSNVNNTIPALTPQLTALKAAVDGLVAGQHVAQKTLGVGLRWDAMRNVAVKAQFDRVKPTTVGLFTADKAGFGGKNVNVYSLSVDTVF